MMDAAFQVIYEDNHLLVVDKEAGVLVQGDQTGDVPLSDMLKEYIKIKFKKPGAVYLATIHRIDRPVSGLVVFARTSKAAERLSKMFQERKVKKTYWALVANRPPADEDTLVNWLKKDHEKNRVHCYDTDRKGGQRAELSYKILGKMGGFYLLEINPVTGRPHQIRVQLAKMGCPIKGDLKYGDVKSNRNKDGRIHLHAKAIEFVHPVKKDLISFRTRVPNEGLWRNYNHF